MRLTKEQYAKMVNNSITYKENKYKSKKNTVDGIKFDSIKESKRYIQLKQLEKLGIIKELELQKIFELQPKYINNKGQHIRRITYKADFFYYDVKKEQYVVEDTKGFKTDVYKIKKKLFEYVYPNLTIEEI